MLKTKKLLQWSLFSATPIRTRARPSSSSLFHVSRDTFLSYSSPSLNRVSENSIGFSLNRNGQRNFCSQTLDKCWNCNDVAQTVPFLVCHSCRSVQSFDPTIDYFQIFGLEKKYEIEEDINLDRKYKEWQKKLHPDLVHSKSEKERGYAALQSARVIDAYRTLSKPLPRAMYILKLEGVHVNEEETISEPELLNEVLEIREAVEEAPDSQGLKQIQSQVQEKFKLWSNSFANAFRNQKFEEAVTAIRRMTYYDRVDEEIVKRL